MTAETRECFTCARVTSCSSTSMMLVLDSHTCPLHQMINLPEAEARIATAEQFGLMTAVRALLGKPKEEEKAVLFETPTPGTTVSERRKQFDIMSYVSVRLLGTDKYKVDGVPILSMSEVVAGLDRETVKQRILDYELANNLIVQDNVNQQPTPPQGAPQMTQPFMPQNGAPPQQPMPQVQPPPQFSGGFQPPPPPMAPPPPVASPQQAAFAGAPTEAPPQEGGKKRGPGVKKGAAVAPPPPPPPAAAAQQFAPPPVPQAAPPQQFAQPAPFNGGFQPPPMPAMAQPGPQVAPPQPQAAPAAAQVDLSPLVAEIRAVGQAVASNAQANMNLVTELRKEVEGLKILNQSLLVALHHLYVTNPQLAQSIQGKDVGDAPKFQAYLAAYLPK